MLESKNTSAVTPLCLEDTLQALGPATDRLVPAAGAHHGVTPAERLLLDPLVPVGRRLLWGNVAAAVAGGFAALTALAERPFDPEHVLPEAARLLDAPGSPTAGLAELFPVTHDGATRLFVRRQTCCLRY